jgi:hypothetical protein
MSESTIRNEVELATELAVSIIFGAAAKGVQKVKLTPNEVTAVGRAIGLLTFVTITPEGNSILSSFTKPEIVEGEEVKSEAVNVSATAAGRKKRTMRGGAPALISLLIGALGLLFGGSQTVNLILTRAELNEVVQTARAQIASACPLDLQLGPPVGALIDWRGDNARALRAFRATEDTCNAVRIAQGARINAAKAEVRAIMDVIPDRVAAFSTAASIASAGPVGFTPPGLTGAVTVGVVMRQITESVISATLPKDLGRFSKDLTTAFPFADAAAAAPGEAAVEGAPASDAADPAEPSPTRRRRSGGARKTKKRAPKRRITRRRPKFMY